MMKKGNYVKLFESYITEVSSKRWREIESAVRDRKLTGFADRIQAHRKKYGTDEIEYIDFMLQTLSHNAVEIVTLRVTDLELREGGSYFKLVGRDASWGTVVIYGYSTNDGKLRMYESERAPLLVPDRANAKKLLTFLSESGIDTSTIDWRSFTEGYTSFKDAY